MALVPFGAFFVVIPIIDILMLNTTQIKCMACLHKSERPELMMDLTVEIDGDIGSLEEALAQFTAYEVLDGENRYFCGRYLIFSLGNLIYTL